MYSPFDINEAVAHRKEYVEEGLRSGSPVVGMSYDGGLLLLTLRRTQRKVYEIYDRQMFSAIGRQSDIENVRLASIQNAHQEGFERSPDDVTLQRMVGFALSPALKKAFGDQMYVPVVIKALFAEVGRTEAHDVFFTLNYDGEFRQHKRAAVIAGTQTAEDRMLERIGESEDNGDTQGTALALDEALRKALSAWSVGAREAMRRRSGIAKDDDEEELNPLRTIDEADADYVFLRDELKSATLEVGLLERRNNRESRFRLLRDTEIDALTREYR
jgi:proteasome alpha subunit